MPSWQPGETVVLRYFTRGRPTGALPTLALPASSSLALWLPAGAAIMRPSINGRLVREVPLADRYTVPPSPRPGFWEGNGIVILGRPGRAHSIWLFWADWAFRGWYVNLEAPWQPTRLGFDTEDHTLDLWVTGDGAWEWKDKDELAVAVELGFFTPEQAAAFHAEGERVIDEWPFPTGWEEWRPDPSWSPPSVPADWES